MIAYTKEKKPRGLKIVIVLLILGGFGGLYAAAETIALSSIVEQSPLTTIQTSLYAAVSTILGISFFVMSSGLWAIKEWARKGTIYISLLNIGIRILYVSSVFVMPIGDTNDVSTYLYEYVIILIVGTSIDALIILYLNRNQMKSFFRTTQDIHG